MDSKPQAVQQYVRTGIVRRFAVCPTHDRKSSDFRGVQWDMVAAKPFWCFACRSGHLFLALPDKSAPRHADVDNWQLAQEAAKTGWQPEKRGH